MGFLVLWSVVSMLGQAEGGEASYTTATSRFATFESMRVHYKVLGRGSAAPAKSEDESGARKAAATPPPTASTPAITTLVLVHGWSCDLTFWRACCDELCKELRLVLIDLPGHGKSDAPEIDYTQERFARSIDAVLKAEHIDRAVLAGHSMGTGVVRAFARLYPTKTSALVAVDGSLRGFFTERSQIEQYMAPLRGDGFTTTFKNRVEGMLAPVASAELKDEIRVVMFKTPRHVVISAGEGMFDPAVWRDDPIPLPLLVLNAKSPFWDDAYEAFVRKIAAQVDYHLIDSVSHFLMMEKPAELNAILREFLSSHDLL